MYVESIPCQILHFAYPCVDQKEQQRFEDLHKYIAVRAIRDYLPNYLPNVHDINEYDSLVMRHCNQLRNTCPPFKLIWALSLLK